MKAQLDFAGASGGVYRYVHFMPTEEQRATGGNYLFVRASTETAAIVFAGETDSLASIPDTLWRAAVDRYGATHLYVRLNLFRQVRLREQADLILAWRPVMNEAAECW